MVKLSNYPHGEHSTEFYAAREADSKAKWHYDRAGKQRGASLSKGIKADYESELLKRGVKDASGEHLPFPRSSGTESQPDRPTRILHGFAFRD